MSRVSLPTLYDAFVDRSRRLHRLKALNNASLWWKIYEQGEGSEKSWNEKVFQLFGKLADYTTVFIIFYSALNRTYNQQTQ